MSVRVLRAAFLASTMGGLVLSTGCGSGSGTTAETRNTDDIKQTDTTAATPARKVGEYPAAPDVPLAQRPRVGVPPFTVSTSQGRMASLDDVAADEADTLLDQWGGFAMIERAQMGQLFTEQGMAGVDPSEAAKMHKIHGVDYLLIGKITNLSIKVDKTDGGMDIGPFRRKNTTTTITSTCGVALRLVDPSTGLTVASTLDDYDQVFSAESSGMSFGGIGGGSGSSVNITDDDRGKLLKMALDDAIFKALPKFTKVLKEFSTAKAAAAAAPAAATPTTP